MVNESEKQLSRPSREEVVAALLSFIEKTTRAADTYKQAQQMAEPLTRSTPIAYGTREPGFVAAIQSGAAALNDCLEAVGGIPASWIDQKNGEHMEGSIMGCKEFVTETGTWNLNFKGPTYTGLIGATPQRLHEILGSNQPDLKHSPLE